MLHLLVLIELDHGASEQEIAGYRDVLNTIHTNFADMPLTSSLVLQLHRDLFQFVPGGGGRGRWKAAENDITETRADGTKVVRFRPLAPHLTPDAMSRLHDGYRAARDAGAIDPVYPRDAFVDNLDLPRGLERELVRNRDREYTLRGSESRTLSVVGSFRVVSSRDLSDHDGRPLDPRSGDLRHLREQGLVRTIPIEGRRDVAMVLTDRGRALLESHRRDRDHSSPGRGSSLRDSRQQFYADLKKSREVEHDMQISNRSRRRSTLTDRYAGHPMASGSLRAASTIVDPGCSRFPWITARLSD